MKELVRERGRKRGWRKKDPRGEKWEKTTLPHPKQASSEKGDGKKDLEGRNLISNN